MIFDGLSLRSSLTSDIITPQSWLLRALGGTKSETGMTVNDQTIYGSVSFLSIANKLANIMGSLPVNIYRTEGRKRYIDREHYLYNLLHFEPSPEIDKFRMMYLMELTLNVYQNFYAQIVRDRAGRIIRLNPLPAYSTWPERNNDGLIEYKTNIDGVQYTVKKEDMFHLIGITKNGLVGIPTYELAKEEFGLELALSSFGSQVFGNGVFPGIIIETPAGQKANKEYLEENLNSQRGGINKGKAHKPLYLDAGQTIKTFEPIKASDAQALESREFSANQIAALLSVPPHFVNYLKDATFSNVEQLGTELVQYSLTPKCARFEMAARCQLFNQQDKLSHYVKIELGGLLRGDAKTQDAIIHQKLVDGRLTINEARELDDRNPIENGDIPMVQYNLGDLNSVIALSKKKAKENQKNNGGQNNG